jgi:branched-chain amino acid aminotransferase
MNTPFAYLNGAFVPFAEAALHLHDAGFVSGATIVDNARTFRHELFRWPDHLARFRRDCADCYVPLEASDSALTRAAHELVAHNAKLLPAGGELQLVTFATPGTLGFYTGSANGPPTLGMATYPLPVARYRDFFTRGVTLAVAGMQSNAPHDLLPPRAKHRSRLFWHVAAHALRDPNSPLCWKLDPPATDSTVVPVVLNGGAADTAIASVLLVMGNTVLAQNAEAVQDSISVKVIEELCPALGLKFERAPLDMRCFCAPQPGDEKSIIPHVSEVLVAGTGFCVAGVRRFGARDRHRDYTWPGPVCAQLFRAWSELVGVDVVRQFTEGGAA